MTNNARPRHAAQGRASRIAGRTALGALAAPMAMLAVAGPAGAATLDLGGTFEDDALDLRLAADGLAAPGLDALGLPALPTELPSELPIDGAAFEGVGLDLFDLGGEEGLGLPALPAADGVALPELPALPGTDDLALPSADSLPIAGALAAVPVALPELPVDGLPALPAVEDLALPELGTDSLPSLPVELPALPVDGLPSLPVVEDVEVPALPSTDDLPELPALPDAVDTATGLAGGLPTSTQLDLDEVPVAADVFSATDLVQGLI
jgi:hypothetical protein